MVADLNLNAHSIGRWPPRILLPRETSVKWMYTLSAATRLFNHRPIGESERFKQERLELAAKIVASNELARKMLIEEPTPLNKAAVIGIWNKLHTEARDALKRRGMRL